MFRIFTLIILLAAGIWFFYAIYSKTGKRKETWKNLVSRIKESFVKLKNPRSLSSFDIINSLKTLSYFIAILCVFILALTGFIPYSILGKPISGFTLVLHASLSPVFAVCMTVLTLLCAHQNLFVKADKQWLNAVIFSKKAENNVLKYKSVTKICFWLLILLAPMVMGSIVLSMYSLFGTYGQESLLILHRVSALLFLIVGIIYTYFVVSSLVPEAEEE